MDPLLSLSNVTKSYDGTIALDHLSIDIPANSYISLLGPSGSGKTTLLRVIAGFDAPDSGAIRIGGRDMRGISPHLRNIGFVFQNFALFPHMTVAQNVAYGLENRLKDPMPPGARLERRVADMLDLVGLAGFESRMIDQISGGQRQRVALARTLITEPRLVLLDEPLGALDANLRERMRDELRAIRERIGVAFLHVTGSETEALAIGETVLILHQGRIAQTGAPGQVFSKPNSPTVAKFLNCYNVIPGEPQADTIVTPVGIFAARRFHPASEHSAYVIRHDQIIVREAGSAPGAAEEGVVGTFIASEYLGAAVHSLFALHDGSVFEVEAHLSHGAPATYMTGTPYRLSWAAQDAIVFQQAHMKEIAA